MTKGYSSYFSQTKGSSRAVRAPQGLADPAQADSESAEELAEEGPSLEAEAITGIEDAPDPNVAEVRMKEVPEDDVLNGAPFEPWWDLAGKSYDTRVARQSCWQEFRC